MTREEFYKKYGDVKVTFSSYYKYTFTYSGVLPDGRTISVDTGGDASEIYHDSVICGTEETINSLYPYAGRVHDDKQETDSFYDY